MRPASTFRRVGPLLAAVLLAGCQAYAPTRFLPGTSADQVRQGMGPPTATYPLPDGGVRYEYARGPYGKHTYMVDFDSASTLRRQQQVLTENNFALIREGMHRDEVLFAIGHPSDEKRLGWQNRMLWSYRYDAVFCLWYQVSFNPQWEVVDTGYGPDPLCDTDNERDH